MIGNESQNWDKKSLVVDNVYYVLKEETLSEIELGISSLRLREINLNNIEQDDFILDSLALDIPKLRHQLDDGPGILIVTGLNHKDYSENELDLIY